MKSIHYILAGAVALIFASCSTSLQQRHVADDLYYTPDKNKNTEIAKEFEEDYSQMTMSQKERMELDTVKDFKKDQSSNPYDEILVDDPIEAQNRREKAQTDPRYGFRNNYRVFFSDDYWLASTYDPMFYNVVVMGDDVWVEPKWMSPSFRYGYNYGNYFGSPYSSWSFGFNNYPYYNHGYYGYHSPFSPYNYGYGYGYGYGYNYYGYGYGYGGYGGYNYYGYGYSPFYDYNYSRPVERKTRSASPTSVSGSGNVHTVRYYDDSKRKGDVMTTDRGRRESLLRSRSDNQKGSFIRRSDRKSSRSSILEQKYQQRNTNRLQRQEKSRSVKEFLNNERQRSQDASHARRYYRRPKNKSNYQELRKEHRRSNNFDRHKNNSRNSLRNHYNSNNNNSNNSSSSFSSGNSNNSSSNSRGSSSSGSSSSGRKKR